MMVFRILREMGALRTGKRITDERDVASASGVVSEHVDAILRALQKKPVA